MRRITRWWPLSILTLLAACNAPESNVTDADTPPDGHTSRNALDWDGVYTGVVPCADCEGIRTRIELARDGTYSRALVYLGRDERPITDAGRFEWHDDGLRITLGDGERAYLELDCTEARMAGKAFCNRYFGDYELHTGGRLRFGAQIGSTMMACPDLDREREFFDMLGRGDNYTLGDGSLSLNRARMAPLARFRDAGTAD